MSHNFRFERQMTNGESTTPKVSLLLNVEYRRSSLLPPFISCVFISQTPTSVNLTELASNSVDQSDAFNQSPVEAVSRQFVNLSK